MITGELNDYYTDDEIIEKAKDQYKVKDLKDILRALPMKLEGMGLLFLDSDIADDTPTPCHNRASEVTH